MTKMPTFCLFSASWSAELLCLSRKSFLIPRLMRKSAISSRPLVAAQCSAEKLFDEVVMGCCSLMSQPNSSRRISAISRRFSFTAQRNGCHSLAAEAPRLLSTVPLLFPPIPAPMPSVKTWECSSAARRRRSMGGMILGISIDELAGVTPQIERGTWVTPLPSPPMNFARALEPSTPILSLLRTSIEVRRGCAAISSASCAASELVSLASRRSTERPASFVVAWVAL
mmetsp:Transcript_82073/g.163446  ORF Transcript_82073/g.163446 Transcript_82073/m.163446 type:complete len:227 (+) Transcript_82073:674-1354(+)